MTRKQTDARRLINRSEQFYSDASALSREERYNSAGSRLYYSFHQISVYLVALDIAKLPHGKNSMWECGHADLVRAVEAYNVEWGDLMRELKSLRIQADYRYRGPDLKAVDLQPYWGQVRDVITRISQL